MSVVTCKFCGANVVWMKTKKGKKILVDASTCGEHDTEYDRESMKCHFETCTKQPPREESQDSLEVHEKLDKIIEILQEIMEAL